MLQDHLINENQSKYDIVPFLFGHASLLMSTIMIFWEIVISKKLYLNIKQVPTNQISYKFQTLRFFV